MVADELLADHVQPFDVVCSLEVVEHVAHVQTFVNSLQSHIKVCSGCLCNYMSRVSGS